MYTSLFDENHESVTLLITLYQFTIEQCHSIFRHVEF